MKNIFFRISQKHDLIISIIIVVSALLISTSLYFGFFEKYFIKQTFEKAFFYRTVGDCDSFIQYIANNQDKWRDRCVNEKNNSKGAFPIKDFKILRINYDRQNQKAFLQVQLTADEKSYTISYELIKQESGWRITNGA